MKTDAITKSYANLSHQQRASLAFTYITAVNELELVRLGGSVPVSTFRGRDPAYVGELFRIMSTAQWWALEHWKALCIRQSLLGVWLGVDDCRANILQDATLKELESCESWLLALDKVLDELGPESGLNPASVRRFGDAEPFRPMVIKQPDSNQMEQVTTLFQRVLRFGGS